MAEAGSKKRPDLQLDRGVAGDSTKEARVRLVVNMSLAYGLGLNVCTTRSCESRRSI